jgi:hypothetical protein
VTPGGAGTVRCVEGPARSCGVFEEFRDTEPAAVFEGAPDSVAGRHRGWVESAAALGPD